MAILEIRPFNKAKVKVVTADGNELKDLLGFVEADIIQGNRKLENLKMLVFKSLTNPCLIGREVLAKHPDTKQHFEALMGIKQSPIIQTNRKETPTQKVCKTRHCDRSSDDDFYDEMDRTQDNSKTKGRWSKYKTMISPEGIQTKVPVNMDRQACKTRVNNSVEKRTLKIENVYNCGNDHKCDENSNEINAIDCPENTIEEEEQLMLVCAIDLLINEQEPMISSLITSDESMAISPNSTINESWTTRKNKSRTSRRERKSGLSDISTPIYASINEESSLMNSNMSQVTEISTRNESSDSMLGEKSQNKSPHSTSKAITSITTETSTRNKLPDSLLAEKSRRKIKPSNNDVRSLLIKEDYSTQTNPPSIPKQ